MSRKLWITASWLILAIGCGVNSPGGPGISDVPNVSGVSNTTTADYRPALGVPEEAFRLVVPTTSIQLNAGESARVAIGIERGRNFQQDVKLSISGLPEGVSIQPEAPTIKAGDPEATLNFHASADTAIGTHQIIVIGHPTSGAEARSEASLTVSR